MQLILNKLYQGKKINEKQSFLLFNNIINNRLTDIELAAAIISMKVRKENYEEIIGAAKSCIKHAKYFPSPDYLFGDIVGTGGDFSNSLNVSTISSFVAACCGIKIVKHCNKAISSKSGSADILTNFNINLNVTPSKSREILDKLNLCFLFAPNYHKGINNATLVRRQLKTRTIFNILGPLINPAKPKIALIGVYNYNIMELMIQSIKYLDYKRAAVVHCEGLDEVSLHATTLVYELRNNNIYHYKLNAHDFGFIPQDKNKLNIKNLIENKYITSKILQGKGDKTHEFTIAANVALLLKLFGYEDIRENATLALEKIKSGKPYQKLLSLIDIAGK